MNRLWLIEVLHRFGALLLYKIECTKRAGAVIGITALVFMGRDDIVYLVSIELWAVLFHQVSDIWTLVEVVDYQPPNGSRTMEYARA